MKFKFLLGVLILVLSTCSVQPEAEDNGIEGQVYIGPMCPVMKVGEGCLNQPYQAFLTVNSPKGKRIVQIQTDKAGRFRIPLQPGEYILHPESPNTLPFAADQAVTVEEGKFTQVTVNYDSGIR